MSAAGVENRSWQPNGESGLLCRNERKSKTMKLALVLSSLLLSSCGALYYGYLPGQPYKFYKPNGTFNLKKKSFNVVVYDQRQNHDRICCSEVGLDRTTELEGGLGYDYFRTYLHAVIDSSNGVVDSTSNDTVKVYLEALSFRLIGVGYIVAHGLVQFSVKSNQIDTTYCSDMTDSDPDAPLKWYSFVTRKTGSRLIASGSLRRAVEHFLGDLSSGSMARK